MRNALRPQHTTSNGKHYLNIGCGDRFHPEWNNVDLYSIDKCVTRANVLQGLPYRDSCFDAVYSSHFLEHVPADRVPKMLLEIFRVLKPNGLVRVVVPDLEYQAKLYLDCLAKLKMDDTEVNWEHYDWAVLGMIDQMTRDISGGRMIEFMNRTDLRDLQFIRDTFAGPAIDAAQAAEAQNRISVRQMPFKRALKVGLKRFLNVVIPDKVLKSHKRRAFRRSGEAHKWMFDEISLGRLLKHAGFHNPMRQTAFKSRIPEFHRSLLDVDPEGRVRKPNSLFIEAEKI